MKRFLALLLLASTPAIAGNTFDELIGAGPVPYPFAALYGKFERTSATLIPDSRSLQRGKVSFAEPRIVIARGQPDNADPPTLFVGYAPKAEELEVIAWNQEKGQFDFLRVTEYGAGKTPVVTEAPRQVCLRCHQSEGPIFPRFPWSETTFNGGIIQKILAARGGDPVFHGLKYSDLQGTDTISLDPAKIDRLVRDANRRLQTARVCRTVCGDDLECRRDLLLAGLADPAYLFQGKGRELRRELIARVQARFGNAGWDPAETSYVSSILPDRDPLDGWVHLGAVTMFEIGDRSSLLRYAVPDLFPAELLLKADLNYEDRLAEFLLSENRGFTPKTVSYVANQPGHPLFRRPRVSEISQAEVGEYLVKTAFACLGFSQQDEARLATMGVEKLRAAAQSDEMTGIIAVWPPEASRVMGQLRQ